MSGRNTPTTDKTSGGFVWITLESGTHKNTHILRHIQPFVTSDFRDFAQRYCQCSFWEVEFWTRFSLVHGPTQNGPCEKFRGPEPGLRTRCKRYPHLHSPAFSHVRLRKHATFQAEHHHAKLGARSKPLRTRHLSCSIEVFRRHNYWLHAPVCT